MARKPKTDDHMLEVAIQMLELHGPETLTSQLLLIAQSELVDLFIKLLKSYRLAARVANAAWKLWELESQEAEEPRLKEARERLMTAFEGYSPANFQSAKVQDYAQKLMELYEQAEHETSLAGVRELLYEEATKALKEAGHG